MQPVDLFRGAIEKFAWDVTFLEVEPNGLMVFGKVDTRDLGTLSRFCAAIAQSARHFLNDRSVQALLRSDARTSHDCDVVVVGSRFPRELEQRRPPSRSEDRDLRQWAPQDDPTPRRGYRGDPCVGECMLSRQPFQFHGYAAPWVRPYGRSREDPTLEPQFKTEPRFWGSR